MAKRQRDTTIKGLITERQGHRKDVTSAARRATGTTPTRKKAAKPAKKGIVSRVHDQVTGITASQHRAKTKADKITNQMLQRRAKRARR